MSLQLNKRKTMLTPKIDKTGVSRKSNWSFRFLHVRLMFQLLVSVEIQSSRSHLQKPTLVVRIGEKKEIPYNNIVSSF
jgi:hypothetical protein